MISRGLWVPGTLTATNEALSLARGSGYFHGFRAAMKENGRWRDLRHGGEGDRYAAAARAVRERVALAARAVALDPLAPGAHARLRFAVHGHARWDVAGAYLAAKWAEDGLCDAGVLRSDRFDVVECAVVLVRDPPVPGIEGTPGMYVGIDEVIP
jgi:hypothetical protein